MNINFEEWDNYLYDVHNLDIKNGIVVISTEKSQFKVVSIYLNFKRLTVIE